MAKYKYQLIKINVPSQKAVVNINANSDKLYKKITGIFASLPSDGAFPGSTLQLYVNDTEIYPEGFELKMITCGNEVSPNDRYYNLEEEASGSTIRGRFTDGGLVQGVNYPYTATLYLRLEEKSEQ
jgi:hypothetical protein